VQQQVVEAYYKRQGKLSERLGMKKRSTPLLPLDKRGGRTSCAWKDQPSGWEYLLL